jgi:hypothetical protein
MTFTINVQGHDDLKEEAKAAFENGLVTKVTELVADIKSGAGVTVTHAQVDTNTSGPVDALGATEGNTAPVTEDHPAEPIPDEDDLGDDA